ncbi:hypothetical protein BC937DRAFT_93516 [Endogone sp. FLAS-F59071]|nr:hypothetical protein BC937DRAFT_93516 [Endogone sp. FLAS-F59071]|eukprot:RUS21143.1 hypothetical protein BC937DRAFT_93516 [Endogone sp. FLAS-F59071]
MATRLDRLVLLLDTGSTAAVRQTAAQQLGEIQKQHPTELYNLLSRVIVHLRSKSWETRIAAGQAIEAIANNVPEWDPPEGRFRNSSSRSLPDKSQAKIKYVVVKTETSTDAPPTAKHPEKPNKLSFKNFDIASVLTNGKTLLGSAGKEYDIDMSDMTPAERLALQRKNLHERLGLDSQFMDVDLLDDTDITTTTSQVSNLELHPLVSSSSLPPVTVMTPLVIPLGPPAPPPIVSPVAMEADMSGLSARERNQLKRKLKTHAKNKGKEKVRVLDLTTTRRKSGDNTITTPLSTPISAGGSFTPATPMKVETDDSYFNFTPQPQSNKIVVEAKPPTNADGQPVDEEQPPSTDWPLDAVCEHLCMDLFDPSWEIRHGAGIGLRSVLRGQGKGAGKVVNLTKEENEDLHNAWLEDAAIRLLCVFALDRFGDFVSDQVVCPVRETCSQTLGVLLQYMTPTSVEQVHRTLLQLIYQSDPCFGNRSIWEVRHAGLLGLKYTVAVRRDLVGSLVEGTIGAVVLGLRDHDDDVRAVSAATLLPITTDFVKLSSRERVKEVVETLWDCLVDLKDDLTASTGAVMDLLARLFECPGVMDVVRSGQSLKDLIPRLYPFFRHTITSVRVAVLNTLFTFLECGTGGEWVDDRVFRLVFQNLLVEERKDIVALSLKVWEALTLKNCVVSDLVLTWTQYWLGGWFELTMTPIGQPLDVANQFYKPPGFFGTALTTDATGVITTTTTTATTTGRRGGRSTGAPDEPGAAVGHNIDVGMIMQDFSLVTHETVMRGRVASSTALGMVMSVWSDEAVEMAYKDVLIQLLVSQWALKRQLGAIVIEEWANALQRTRYGGAGQETIALADKSPFARTLSEALVVALESGGGAGQPVAFFYEFVHVLKRIRGECQALLNSFVTDGLCNPNTIMTLPTYVVGEMPPQQLLEGEQLFSVETASEVAKGMFDQLMESVPKDIKRTVIPLLKDRQKRVFSSVGYYEDTRHKAEVNVYAAVAGAVVALGVLPIKLNPVVRSVMNSVKYEENPELQQRSSTTLATLVSLCATASGRINPNDKIVKNLCAFLCSDPSVTPVLETNKQSEGILSVQREDGSIVGHGGKKDDGEKAQHGKEEESPDVKEAKLMQRGAQTALKEFCTRFGDRLLDVLPKLWECLCAKVEQVFGANVEGGVAGVENADRIIEETTAVGQEVVDSMILAMTVVPFLDEALWQKIIDILPNITKALQSHYAVIRSVAARCLATICSVITIEGMQIVIDKVLPLLGDTQHVVHRQGAAEMIYHLVQTMDAKILPYVIFLIVPILGRMSDVDEAVRLVTTNCFALLIKLVPLEAGIPDPPGMSKELLMHRDVERKFLAQLLDSSKLENFEITVTIKAELRKYQQEGVNWLAFLNKYQLHGILCDDMGLGKTLQSICILASDHHVRSTKYAQTNSPDTIPMPSLVVCPPTLTGHWYHEVLNYTDTLRPLLYTGGPPERKRLRSKIKDHDVIIMSYDIVRNDIEDLSDIHWNYCILDEGHIIKNGKTKITKAVKSVRANHRLILSGTPIQNNVLELWSLFDFLMPGFLGSEKIFNERFGKPILSSRDSKSSSKEQEAGALALEALHKQVLPFLLRRLKEDVLHDLPPKIIQDYYCELSDLQKQLYEGFAKSQTKHSLEGQLEENEDEERETGGQKKATHIFQALQYLRKLCNHPLLVVNEKHPKYKTVMNEMKNSKSSLHDIYNAPKLLALKQLLTDCGIGVSASDSENDPTAMAAGAVSQHRALIFCQLKTMIDIIENDLLKSLMPSVTYMRLDGSVDANKRHDIVQKFNADPSIDLLLLTTHVGGLGLNLTGADTVIFVEHDWNPMKDLQAMDRAHRIGQKKVVNVYRLITKGTLEEKIMGLQKFKLNIANTIVNQQNTGLQSMDTDQILDLFNVTSSSEEEKARKRKDFEAAATASKRTSTKAVLENLENLWDDKQYEEEYNLDSFIQGLK